MIDLINTNIGNAGRFWFCLFIDKKYKNKILGIGMAIRLSSLFTQFNTNIGTEVDVLLFYWDFFIIKPEIPLKTKTTMPISLLL